jgi:quinol monooxygenase YgiN
VSQPTENAIMTGEEALSRLSTATEPGIPLFVSVTLTIRPERLDAFTAALTDVLPRAQAEDACLHLDVGRMVVDPNVFVLWERWRDLVEYRDIILQKDYFQEYMRISEDSYARPRVVTLLEPFASTSSEHTPMRPS